MCFAALAAMHFKNFPRSRVESRAEIYASVDTRRENTLDMCFGLYTPALLTMVDSGSRMVRNPKWQVMVMLMNACPKHADGVMGI